MTNVTTDRSVITGISQIKLIFLKRPISLVLAVFLSEP